MFQAYSRGCGNNSGKDARLPRKLYTLGHYFLAEISTGSSNPGVLCQIIIRDERIKRTSKRKGHDTDYFLPVLHRGETVNLLGTGSGNISIIIAVP
jgi:hypothetical protein